MADRIQFRRDTKANWASVNPVLLDGEIGYVTDDNSLYKIGDGVHQWNELSFRGFDGTISQTTGDSEVAVMSQKAVTDNFVRLEQEQIQGGVYDVSAHNNSAVFESLQALLSSSNLSTLIPTSVRHGGMSIRFIQGSVPNSDNKYVQCRCTANEFTTDVTQWQIEEQIVFTGTDGNESLSFVDEEGNCPMQVSGGHIKTKNFDSSTVANKTYVGEKIREAILTVEEEIASLDYAPVDNVDDNDESLSVVDESDECIVQFKNGHVKTKYFDSENIHLDTPQIIIPDTITAVVDDTLQIYYKSVLDCSNYKNYGIVVSCDIGKSFPRYYEVKPTASRIGNHTLTISVYGVNGEIVATKQIQLQVVAKLSSQSPAKNILTVGASTYTSGTIISEVNRRFSANSGDGTPANPTGLGLTGINFIGRKEVAGIHQEATGGYSWKTYATDALKSVRFNITGVSSIALGDTYYISGYSTSQSYPFTVIEVNITEGVGNILCEVYGGYIYSSLPESGTLVRLSGSGDDNITYTSYLFEEGNPFWYNDAVDFIHYSDTYCNGADIDVLYTHLGLNSFRSSEDVDNQIDAYVKPFIRKFHTDYPNGKFILGTLQLGSPNGGYGYSGSSQNWFKLADVYLYTLLKYQELAESQEFSSYVSITNCTAEFDCEYGYPETNKAVDNRVSTTEVIQTNQIHPTETAKKMISDSIYRALTKLFN